MNNSINSNNLKINNTNNATKNAQAPELVTLKQAYRDFVKKMDKSDFCNTSRRYILELSYIKKLKEVYTQYQDSESFQEISDREKEILEKLKNEFGITFKTN